jgi:hypothetical protein
MEGWPSALWPAQSGSACQAGEGLLESIASVPPPSRIEEEGRHFAVRERSVTYSSVVTQDLQCRTMKWNDSAFAKLALSDQQRCGFPVYVSTVQTNDFTDA